LADEEIEYSRRSRVAACDVGFRPYLDLFYKRTYQKGLIGSHRVVGGVFVSSDYIYFNARI
jgi:hypothetical protein